LQRQRTVKRDDIRLAKKIADRNAVLDYGCMACWPLGDKNFHAEAARDFRHPSADVAVTDDAELFTFELDRRITEQSKNRAFFPLATSYCVSIFRGTGGQFQNQRNRELRYGFSGVTRYVANSHTTSRSCLPVDNIRTRGGNGDQLYVARFRRPQNQLIDFDFIRHHD